MLVDEEDVVVVLDVVLEIVELDVDYEVHMKELVDEVLALVVLVDEELLMRC